ncbi:MAG: phosphatidate cytidylyltransferase [Spirochaetales bacterium]
MRERTITAIFITLGLALAFLFREVNLYVFDGFIAILSIVCALEVSRVFLRSGRANFMGLEATFATITFIMTIWGINAQFSLSQFILGYLIILIVMFSISFAMGFFNKRTVEEDENFKASKLGIYEYSYKKSMLTLFIMIYPTLLFVPMYLLNHIQELNLFTGAVNAYTGVNLGLFLLVTVFLVTMATDTLALLVGMTLKGPKLAPLISPKKTISGAIGGLFGGMVMAVALFLLASWFTPLGDAFSAAGIQFWLFIIYGFVASIISQIGDLFASYIKRRARAKDFSSVLPGHGGFMDRLDGILFNAVFSFIFFMIVLL